MKTKVDKNENIFIAIKVFGSNNLARRISELLTKGASLADKNTNHQTPIEFASALELWECVKIIADNWKTDANDSFNFGLALFDAVKANKICALKILIRANALLPWFSGTIVRKDNEETPVEIGIRLKHWDCVQLMLENDKNNKKTEIIESLHYANALINTIKAGNYVIAKLLLENQAPCNKWNSEVGNIVLYEAIKIKRKDIVELLISWNADPYIKNKDGKNSFDLAKKLRQPDLLPILLSAQIKNHAIITQKTPLELVNERSLLLKDNAVPANIMPSFLRLLLDSMRSLLSEDYNELQKNRNISQDVSLHKSASVDLLIKTINSLINYPEKPIEIEQITKLANGGSLDASHILQYINLKDEVLDYTKRLRLLLLDAHSYINNTPWRVMGFFGMKDGIPTQIESINKEIFKLKSPCSYNIILDVAIEIIKLSSIIPQIKSENTSTIDFLKYLSQQMQSINFDNSHIDIEYKSGITIYDSSNQLKEVSSPDKQINITQTFSTNQKSSNDKTIKQYSSVKSPDKSREFNFFTVLPQNEMPVVKPNFHLDEIFLSNHTQCFQGT